MMRLKENADRDPLAFGWVCALPIEVAAAKATLDRVRDDLPPDRNSDDDDNYVLGSLQSHNIVVAYPNFRVCGKTSVAGVTTQLRASYTFARFNLMVGITGVPDMKGDIHLGDSTPLLLTAIRYISEIMQKDPVTFAHPGPEQDVLFKPNYDYATIESEESGCSHCDPHRIRSRQPREVQGPVVHYGLIASSHHLTRHGATRDKPELWHAHAAAAAAAYAKEVLSFIPKVSKTIPLATNSYAEAAPVLDALLLIRPEIIGSPSLHRKGTGLMNRNIALTIMRGILHQRIDPHPHLAKDIKNSFEGMETTEYTVSSFVSLWRVFLTLLQQSTFSRVVCTLDGLDECEKESLGSFSMSLGITCRSLGKRLGQYQQIQLGASDTEISHDVERYIFAKVAELASEQTLFEEMVAQVQETLLAGADGTFLWVGFVANELQGRSWSKIDEVLRYVPKGLGGIYQRLLQQIGDKEALVSMLQWVVLASRPLILEELTVAAGINEAGTLPATQVTKNGLRFGGLLVKVERDAVNLVHESAKETLMQTYLVHAERGYGNPGRIHEMSGHDPFLSHTSQYWLVHFHHAIHVIDAPSEFSRPFFLVDSPIRDEWWKVYWEQEKNGGSPPSFTLASRGILWQRTLGQVVD
ncbi:hypothetical protein EKO27_g4961 [Xylaria grammica]|uniref:Nephrocystin 3-like N-terminal domain-containing protein n=1 Tax=Xylaria grammica TaxID=363999 RepID=A0A439D6W4_9PEZI|nr:hypothetical protein EKO27_g4961 [Xylaria grammica]